MTLVNAILSSTLKVSIVFGIVHRIVALQILINDILLYIISKEFGFGGLQKLFLKH